MKIRTAFAASLLIGSLFNALAQTNTNVFQSNGLFRATFRATCFATDASGQVASTKLTEKDIISRCVGASGLSTKSLTRTYALAYDPNANVLRVIRLSDGALLCDVIQFQDVAVTSDTRQSEQFTFMFVPDQTNSIGSAIITQKFRNNNNNADISGKVQFVLTDDMALGSTNATFGTNATATANGLAAEIAAVESVAAGNQNAGFSTTTNAISTNVVTTPVTNTVVGTNVAVIGTNNAIGTTNTNAVSVITSNIITEPNISSTATTATTTSNTVFTIGTPVNSLPPTSLFSTTNSVADTNVNTVLTNTTITDTNAVATSPVSAITDTNAVNTSVTATNLTNARICNGTFTANRRLLVNLTP